MHATNSTAWPSGFMLIQGNRLEDLRDLMTDWMRRHPLGPLEDEVILVQSNGIGQWLKLALARPVAEGGMGIAAAVQVILPARFIWQTYGQILQEVPDICAYHKTPMGWRLYRLLGDLAALDITPEEAEALEPLQAFLDTDDDVRRRYQLAMRLADLFDQYQVYRGDWLQAWLQGEDQLIRPDGRREALPDAQRWQAVLWRVLNTEIAALDDPNLGQSRAQVHQEFLTQVRTLTQRPAALPRRVIVFGISSLPRQTLEVLEALGHLSQIMLFVHNPCQHYWGDLIEGRDLFRQRYRRQAARKIPEDLDPDLIHLYGHPLLAAWGKQGRDYIRLLDEHDRREAYEDHFQAQSLAIDLFTSPGQDTLLQQLQDDILELRPLIERREQDLAIDPASDHSLQFIVAHSPQREVEILHDQLLDAFAQAHAAGNPLPARDILIMVPDINTHAPHIEAVFGRLSRDDPRYIPFHIADQGQRHRNPILIGLETLLNLPRLRLSVSEILDLLDIAALRARFGIDSEALPRLRHWIEGARICWGLDAEQRASLGMPAGLSHNTWAFGLDRMLLGVTNADSGPWQEIEPYSEVAGLEAGLLGHLEHLLSTVQDLWQRLQSERTPLHWVNLILELLERCFVAQDEADTRALDRIQSALEQWLKDCHSASALDASLPLEIVRDAVLEAVDTPSLNQHFLAGSVNFATLMPMRAIPFRQIWLLGMNDGDYPRSQHPADFDLMAQDYRPGDRSRREDDRYLLLEALLSARERLVISWVGRSIHDNSERPPSVLIGQLRDHLAAGWSLHTPDGPQDGQALLQALTTEHPLQPFSTAYFHPQRPAALFTYAHEWQGLHTETPQARETPPVLDTPTPTGPLSLTTLSQCLRQPVNFFCQHRLGLWFKEDTPPPVDDEPFSLVGLERWALHQQILTRLHQSLREHPDGSSQKLLEASIEHYRRAGHLPLAPLDSLSQDTLIETLLEPVDTYRSLQAAFPHPTPARNISLQHTGWALEDRLSDLQQDATGQVVRIHLQPNALNKAQGLQWHHLIRHWPAHLAAQLEGPVTSHLLGPHSHVILPSLEAAAARTYLHTLLSHYPVILSQLLPLACKTGFQHLADQHSDKKPQAAALYEGGFTFSGEYTEHPVYQRFWPTFADLSADGRFAQQVQALYGPLYECITT